MNDKGNQCNIEDKEERAWVDLHVHSTASDGTFTPEELVAYAEEKKLYAFALTDHDTVDGVKRAKEAAKKTAVTVIPGIEISADYEGQELHILGLCVDEEDADFLKTVESCRTSRDNRNQQMIEKIRGQGLYLTEDILRERFGEASLTRAHFAQYMIDEGFVGSKDEAFERYLNPGKPCYVPRAKITPEDAIQTILRAKGHPVLAHPLLYKMGKERLYTTLLRLKEAGMEGIEGIYSLNTPSDDRYLAGLAEELGFFITGGSDFHGSIKPKIDLGCGMGNLKIPREILKWIMP